jgi:hypothetical protein
MKTMKTFFALLISTLFLGGSAMASGNLKLNISGAGNDLAEVEITNAKISTFEIEVVNEYGETVFVKETKAPANNYKRKYDFSKLEDGTYYFTVKIDNESSKTKFDIKGGEIKILEEMKMVDPVFIFEDDLLKLTYLNFAGENTTVFVYDRYGNELFSKDLKSTFAMHHGVDFSNAAKGSYEVVLSNINEIHSYDVFID